MTYLHRQLLLGLFIGLFGVMISLAPLGLALEEKFGLSWLFKMRGEVSVPQDVVVVSIDQSSATQLGLPSTPNLWPRTLHAHLIENLTAAGARVIAFDLVFDKPSDFAGNDEMLAHAIEKAGNVVLVERLDFEEAELFLNDVDLNDSHIANKDSTQLLPIIADAAIAHAPFPLPNAARVNNYWAFKTSAGDAPTMVIAALQVFALPVYDDFIGLLRNVEPDYAAKLPANKANLNVEDLIFTLRNIFVHDPQLARQMQAALNSDSSFDSTEKQLINSLLSLYSGDAMRYLNFYGPPRSVKTVPYHQVLQLDSMDPSEWPDFSNKAVFVGLDDHRTAFPSTDWLFISGVEIAATAFANLLENRPIRPLPAAGNLGLLFLLGFGMAIIFLLWPNWKVYPMGGFLIVFYILFVLYQFKETSIWLPLVVPLLLQMPLALFGSIFLKYVDAKRELEQIKDVFGYFVPQRIVNDIAKSVGPIIPTNQVVYGTCLAADANMYTTLSERMGPLQLSQLMNDYYAVLFEPVKRHNGIVADVVGDAVLAIWAAPNANANLRRQACLACLDIESAVNQFNQNNDVPLFHLSMGLHFGEMLLGSIGAVHHYEYKAVGDIVNTTNRIQDINKYLGTRLLISAEVAEDLDEFLIRPLGSFQLFGKTSSVGLAELIIHKELASKEQLWLCAVFSNALYAYQSQKWQEAIKNFSEILKVFPNDGPSLFFFTRCQQLMMTPPVDLWNPTIRMEDK